MFHFYTHENVRKLMIFGHFQGVRKLNLGVKWVNVLKKSLTVYEGNHPSKPVIGWGQNRIQRQGTLAQYCLACLGHSSYKSSFPASQMVLYE